MFIDTRKSITDIDALVDKIISKVNNIATVKYPLIVEFVSAYMGYHLTNVIITEI